MKEASLMTAQLMAAAMRTAPKAGGKDFLEIVVISDDVELQRLSNHMLSYAPDSTNEAYWRRDAANIAATHAVVLVGLKRFTTAGYDCGGCGYPTCAEFSAARQEQVKEMGYTGPHCIMRMMDIGAALASAAKTASLLNIDNRVQQRVGAAARALGLIDADVVMGIPIGVFGKNIFFDRPTAKH
ncbi:DUF2148 domain-containing protein [Candidatus Magnetaquicoccus inordinatus]|uniref:DUF2148 domain-containing protein n=1 Tax=Candidatus Magnetaquicoccus inordinatus TaxID=2496818 RepID=UPI00102C50AC|nr:DUF2148 domain-containing protein [Candidatus Magnetaquicoccus inordinatus]